MRIDPAAAIQAALLGLLKTSRGAAAKPPFPAPSSSVPAAAPAASPAVTTSSISMLVAMSALAPRLPRPSALRRAEQGIDGLGRLHRSLLSGASPDEALKELRSWGTHDAADADIAELLREVELRVLVELAKAKR